MWVGCMHLSVHAVNCNNISLQCHRGRSLDAFFDGIQSDPVKLAVVGCGCSIATEPVAEISHQWNISQVLKYKNSEGVYCSIAHQPE